MPRPIPIATIAFLACGCVQIPEDPTTATEAQSSDAAVAFGLGTGFDAGPDRPPTAAPYDGPECDSLAAPHAAAPDPMGAAAPGTAPDVEGDPASQTTGDPVGLPGATMDGGAPVASPAVGDLFFTELMPDPATLNDGVGEWIELHNPGEVPYSLDGCALMDGEQRRQLPAGALIPAGGYHVLARSEAAVPGPVTVVSFTLNNGGDCIALHCGGVEIDVVAYDGDFPVAAGASLALSHDAYDADLNDWPESWCPGEGLYAGDLGTPGAANPPCHDGTGDDPDAGI